MIDERGTGRSEPHLACPEFAFAIPTTAPYEDRAADRLGLATLCRQRLESDGVDLDGYDTVESAADFVDLRHALGIDQFVLRGVSYGARLAREIYRQDPRRGRRAAPRQSGHDSARWTGQPDRPGR